MTIDCPNFGRKLFDVSPSKDDSVKTEHNSAPSGRSATQADDLARPSSVPDVNDADEVEASAAKGLRGGALTAAMKAEIRELHLQGYATARIRQMIGFERVTFGQVVSVVKAKR